MMTAVETTEIVGLDTGKDAYCFFVGYLIHVNQNYCCLEQYTADGEPKGVVFWGETKVGGIKDMYSDDSVKMEGHNNRSPADGYSFVSIKTTCLLQT